MVNNATKMYIANTGNIGIGTTTPAWNLQIASSTKTQFALSDMSAAADQKHWLLSSMGGSFYISTSSDALATSTISALTINSNGYIGIATTSPYKQLSVNGNAYVTGTMQVGSYTLPNTDGSTGYILKTDGSGAVSWQADNSGAAGGASGWTFIANGIYNATSTDTVMIGGSTISNAANSLEVTGSSYFSGNVGIGTTTPNWNLQVAGTRPFLTLSDMSAGLDAKHWFMSSQGGNLYIGTSSDDLTSTTTYLTVSSAGQTTIGNSDSSEAMRITAAGNVGIGTSSPLTKLSVQGTAGQPILNIASSTGASLLYINEFGNVGIGTANPGSYKLYVNGIGYFNSNIYGSWLYGDKFLANIGSAALPSYSHSTDSDTGMFLPDGNIIGFSTGSAERMRITSSGNVGIGTTSPYSLLSISNSVSTPANTPLFTIASTTGGTATSTFMTVLANGNVGIGTANPTTKLEVSGAISASSYINSSTFVSGNSAVVAGTSGMYYSILASGNYGFGAATSLGARPLTLASGNAATYTDGYINFSTAGLERMRVSSDGNVGIGTTTPAWNLQIASSTKTQFALSDMSAAANQKHWVLSSMGGSLYIATSSDALATSTFTALSINSNGYIGIGTTSPSKLLSVNGNAYVTGTLQVGPYTLPNTDGSDGQVLKTNAAGVLTWSADNSAAGASGVGWASSTLDTTSIYFTGSGKVGIGTTTPNSLFHIAGPTPKFTLSDTSAGANLKHWFMQSSGGSLYFATTSDALVDSGTRALTINSLGYVGIGTSSPQTALHIGTASSTMISQYGNSLMVSGELEVAGSAYLGAMEFPTDGGAISWIDMAVSGSVATGTIESYTARIGGTDILTVYAEADGYLGGVTPSSSRVGIGTTSPFARLSIAGAGTGTGYAFAVSDIASTTRFVIQDNGYVGIGTTSPSQKLSTDGLMYIGGTGTSTIENNLHVRGNLQVGLGTIYITGSNIYSSDGSINLSSGAASSTFANGLTVGTDKFIVQQGSGYVGVGTTSPYQKLSVDGNAYINGTLQVGAYTLPATDGASGQVLKTDAAGNLTWSADNTGGGGLTGTVGQLAYFSGTDTAAGTSTLFISTAGRVGAGTTTPTAKLAIAGTAGVASEQLFDVASSSGASLFHINSDGRIGLNTADPMGVIDAQMYVSNATSTANFNGLSSPWFGFGTYQNYLLQTEVLATTWAAVSTTRTANDAGDPRMGATGDRTGYGTADTAYVKQQIINSTQGPWTFSVWLRSGDFTNATSCAIAFDFGTGTATTTITKNITVGKEWQRYSVSGVATTTHSWKNVYVINGRNNIGVWGAQFEPSIFASQYSNAQTTSASAATPYSTAHINSALNISGAITGGSSLTISGAIASVTTLGLSGILTQSKTALASSTAVVADGVVLWNTTAATSVLDAQWSPRLRLIGNVWDTGASLTRSTHWMMQNQTYTGNPGISNLAFQYAYNGTATSTPLVLSSTGNIGMGTSSPEYGLDVYGSAAFGLGSEVMRIDSTGNVGIGTSSPFARLSVAGNGSGLGYAFAVSDIASTTRFVIQDNGNVGIGTTSPYAKLSLVGSATDDSDIFAVSTSSSGAIFRVTGYGNVLADGTITGGGADYAEYFRTLDSDLMPGETVCVDLLENNAVKRCERGHDNNAMGIVSTKPSIVGNNSSQVKEDPASYVIVGMLGQVDAFASAENGAINIGDSLTSASSTPGYAMRADGGDSTIGVALEPLNSGTGKIKVLISRRNKSLAVEEVEALVVERIAGMEIEDEVQLMIKQAVDNLDLDPKIAAIAEEEANRLDAVLTVRLDDTNGLIADLRTQTLDSIMELNTQIAGINNEILSLRLAMLQNDGLLASTTALAEKIKLDEQGNLVIGASKTSDVSVRIVDITEITASSTRTALVINQAGSGDIADFQADGVSIMNIASDGQVKIVGSMLVDGRIMLCTGGNCSDILDSAVDETMADLGVEGKVVAGAFEGYCDEGFVWIPGSAEYGTLPGFCVMNNLAGSVGNPIPSEESDSSGPITNVSQGQAQAACQALGAGYHLIGENEWLTIAADILQVAANDSDANAAGLQLATSSASYKLTNGNIINNLPGTGEWTKGLINQDDLPVVAGADWAEYGAVSSYKSLSIIRPPYYLTDANNYIGKIKVGEDGSMVRGCIRGVNGIYSLDLSQAPETQSENIGFRCAK
ncbi:MAG: peptidase G2 autoproteolytic cleavage domain-containing protein [Patescibacteria group bacterium]